MRVGGKEVISSESKSKDDYFCPKCNRDIPARGSSREYINSNTKRYWYVVSCPRCGTVTSAKGSPFSYGNLLPRIGPLKSFLFVFCIIGGPFHAVAWGLGGVVAGGIVSGITLAMSLWAASGNVYEVEDCPYQVGESYPELIKKEK